MRFPGGAELTERYALREKLGAGGMGVVYRAFDQVRNSDVALKTFLSSHAGDLYRLKKEFRALADVRHPNVVELYELTVQEDGECFYTMELVEGVDPRSYCGYEKQRPIPETRVDSPAEPGECEASPRTSAPPAKGVWCPDFDAVRRVARGLCQGVAALHDAGKLHRDLKCSNLLVTASGDVKVLDFGLIMDRHDALADSFAGKTVGTLAYMSPEQAGGRSDLTPATDWYSVGVILFELLTGEVPFEGSSIRVIVDKQQKKASSVRVLRPDAPSDLAELCDSLLATAPESRPRRNAIFASLGVATGSDPSGRFSITRVTHEEEEAFTGRAAELDALVCDFNDVREGTAVLRVIDGPSGIGKSSLVRAFVRRMREAFPSIVFIEGKCREQERVTYRALDSVMDSLSAAWSRLPSATAHMILPRHVGCLMHLFPVLGRVPAVADAPVTRLPKDPRERRNLAYRALRELFERLTEVATVVLFVDDFQWTDPESHLLLTEVIRPPESPAMLTLLAARDVDVTTMGPADTTVAVLGDALRHTQMSALRPEEMRLLLLRHLPDATPRQRSVVTTQAGGNPFFLTELARYIALDGGAAQDATLHDAIRARLSHMPEAVQLVTRLVCVSHEALRMDVLRVASRLEAPEAARAVALARTAKFIKSAPGSGASGLEPFHDQTRAALLAGEAEVPELHRRLARAYQGLQVSSARTVARHFHEGGEPDLALEAYLAAGLAAEASNDLENAAQLYQIAAELSPPPAKAKLYWRCANVHATAGRQLAAARAGETALQQGFEEGREQVAVWYGMAGHAEKMQELIPSQLLANGFVARATRASTMSAVLWRLLVLTLVIRGAPREGRAQRPEPRFAIARAAGLSRSRFDYPTTFLFVAIEALRIFRHGSRPEVAYWFAFLAQVLHANGISLAEKALEHAAAAQLGNEEEVQLVGTRGFIQMMKGHWQASADTFRSLKLQQMVEDDRAVERRFYERFAIYNLFYWGALKEFAELHDVVLRRTIRMGELEDAMRLTIGLAATARLMRDEPALARAERERAQGAQGAKSGVLGYFVWASGILTALYTENQGELREALSRAPSLQHAAGFSTYYRASHASLTAAAAAACTAGSDVHDRYTRRLMKTKLPWAKALGLYNLGLRALYDGDHAKARVSLERAYDDLRAADMRLYANAVKLRLGQLSENQVLIDETYEWAARETVVNWTSLARVGAPARPGTFVEMPPSAASLARIEDIVRRHRDESDASPAPSH